MGRVRRKNRRARREHRLGLGRVNLGLQFHSGALLMFLAGVAMGTLSCGALAPVSVACAGVASMINLPFPILCLAGPPVATRWTLIASLVLAGPPLVIAVAFFALGLGLGASPLPVVIFSLLVPALTFMASHFLWLWYIKDLAHSLQRPELGEAVTDLQRAELKYFFVVLPGMFLLVVSFLFCSMYGTVTLVAALITFYYKTSDMDLWEVLLYPTGVPLLVKYYNLIATLRNVLIRHL